MSASSAHSAIRHALGAPVALLAAVGGLGLAACGEEKPARATPVSIEVTERGRDGARLKAPNSVPGGLVELRLENSAKKPHDAQLIRVDGDHEVEEVLRVFSREGGPIPPWMHGAGGVAATPPGQTRSTTQVLPAGNYYIIDVEGADDPKDAPTAPIKVQGGQAEAELPSAPATITAKDYTFTTSGLKAGKNKVVFDNAGPGQLHHAIVAPLKPGKTIDDVRRFAMEQEGPPPIDEENSQGTPVLDPGVKQITELDLKPGKYALLCFISDRSGGPPHVAKGMITEATVP